MTLLTTFLLILACGWILYYTVAMAVIYRHVRKINKPMPWEFLGIAITGVALSFILAMLIV